MARQTWDKETLSDVLVNVVPLAVLVVFIGLFLLIAPWGVDLSAASLVQFGLIVSMMILLGYLTYLTAERI